MQGFPAPGAAMLLAVGGQTWRTELLGADPERLRLGLGAIPPQDLLRLDPGAKVSCRFHDSQALCLFDSHVLGQATEDGIRVLELATPANVSRSQRRRHLRVSRRVPMKVRLPLRHDTLSKAKGRDFIQSCWVEAVAVNISAGGARLVLTLPRQYSVSSHQEALVRFELNGEVFKDRRLSFIRRDWSTDDVVLVYAFADFSREETERVEGFNLTWLNQHGQTPE